MTVLFEETESVILGMNLTYLFSPETFQLQKRHWRTRWNTRQSIRSRHWSNDLSTLHPTETRIKIVTFVAAQFTKINAESTAKPIFYRSIFGRSIIVDRRRPKQLVFLQFTRCATGGDIDHVGCVQCQRRSWRNIRRTTVCRPRTIIICQQSYDLKGAEGKTVRVTRNEFLVADVYVKK